MKKVFVILIFLLIFLVACTEMSQKQVAEKVKVIEPTSEPVVEEPTILEFIGCTDISECEGIEQCIEGECKTIAQLYKTDCDVTCNFNSVVVETSDGESYIFNRGQGSYSYAGALAWTLQGGPDYCKEDEIIVPIKLEKISGGKALETQTIILSPGETSKLITHPTIKKVSFTAKIVSVEESCG